VLSVHHLPVTDTAIELDADGQLLFVRRASRPDDVARLEREAAVLERLDHPGVVSLVALRAGDDGSVALVTAFVGGASLAEQPPASASEVVGLLAAVAATLSHAHAAGLAHGALTADQILRATDGSPVIAGWGWVGEDSSSPSADQDVVALGQLVHALLGGQDGDTAAAARALAARATVPDGAARPTIEALAASLRAIDEGSGTAGHGRRLTPRRDAVPTAAETPGSPAPPPREAGRRRRASVLVLATVVVGIVAGTALGLLGDRTGSPGAPPRAGSTPSSSIDTSGPAGGDTPAAAPAPTTWAAVPTGCVPEPAPDRDGCHPPVIEGGVVAVGGARWAVGDEADLVVIGSWDCGAVPTPAVVRPATGHVWVYARWATTGADVAARSVARLGAAAQAVAIDEGDDGCHEIGVVRPDGSQVVVDPREAGA
jgi:hypothetical protein